jgi:predicted alpha/beta superfamily hydrolase
MKTRLLLLLLCLSGQLIAQLTLKVTQVPSNTPQAENIYVAGNFQNWNPGDPNYILTKNTDGSYQITVNPPAGLLKYKFTRGNWATVEGNADGTFLPDREFNYTGVTTTLELKILSWEDLGGGGESTAAENVHLLDQDFYMPQLDRNRRIWMYLPPDYDSSNKKYPVIYMQDGQNCFDALTSFSGEWQVDESLNQLFNQGDYGCIVVAIDNGGTLRFDEYAPWLNGEYNQGGEGAKYIDFIVETLKPYIDSHYRTLAGREYTALFGSSVGALISQYGIVAHQDVFSKAGLFSPAFWFNDPEIYTQVSGTPKLHDLKLYYLAGYPEGQGSVVADVNQMGSVLLNNGYGSQEIKKQFHADGQHSEWYWAREFPAAYLWLFAGTNFTGSSEASPTGVRVRPNPADTLLYVENLPALKRVSYQFTTPDGRVAGKGKLGTSPVDVSRLPPGMYVFTVFSKKQVVLSQRVYIWR